MPMTSREFLALVEKVRMLKKLKEESKLAMMTPMGGLDPYRPKGAVGRNITLDHQALGCGVFFPPTIRATIKRTGMFPVWRFSY